MCKYKIMGILTSVFIIISMLSGFAFAIEAQNEVCIGEAEYENLESAMTEVQDGETIKLLTNVELDECLKIEMDKEITIDLNGKNISATSRAIHLAQGKLNIIGKGKIIAIDDFGTVIRVSGSDNEEDTNYSVFKMGKDVTIEGYTGILITHDNKKVEEKYVAYGVVVDIDGTVKSPANVDKAAGNAITINGNIQHSNNCPQIVIRENTKVIAESNKDTTDFGGYDAFFSTAIYAAGYAKWDIKGGTFQGDGCIEIKAGEMIIGDGEYSATEEKNQEANNNGTSSAGYSLALVENSSYGKPINVIIKNGKFLNDVDILDDDSNEENNEATLEIEGGLFKNIVAKDYIKDGYVSTKGMYFESGKTYKYKVDLICIAEDVSEDIWYNEPINYVLNKGLFNGISDNEFNPDGYMTRGMFITVLWRIDDNSQIVDNSTFEDVDDESYYAKAIAWASDNNIVQGVGNGKFAPDEKITREQLATILLRYSEYKEEQEIQMVDVNLSGFSDSDDISEYAINAMKWATKREIIKGKDNKMLDAKGNATRAEAATIIMRYIEI